MQPAFLMATTKRNTFRVYLNEEETARLKTICEKTELGQSELLSKIASAAFRAVEENNYRISLPLRFVIAEAEETRTPTVKNLRRT